MRSAQVKLRLIASTALALVLGAGQVGHARADFYWGNYISSGDPINLIFDINGSLANSRTLVEQYLLWSSADGSNQLFPDHSDTPVENTEDQRNSGCCNQYHVRFNQGNDDGGPSWGTWTMAPAHHENVVWCDNGLPGHAVDTFDGARDTVVQNFQSRQYTTGRIYRTLNAASRQCDGTSVAGDGYYWWIDIN